METWLPSTSATLSRAGAMWVSSETGSLSTTEWKGFSSPSSSSCCLATCMSFIVVRPTRKLKETGCYQVLSDAGSGFAKGHVTMSADLGLDLALAAAVTAQGRLQHLAWYTHGWVHGRQVCMCLTECLECSIQCYTASMYLQGQPMLHLKQYLIHPCSADHCSQQSSQHACRCCQIKRGCCFVYLIYRKNLHTFDKEHN